MTAAQLEPSAQAPWTSTIVGLAAAECGAGWAPLLVAPVRVRTSRLAAAAAATAPLDLVMFRMRFPSFGC